jgi:hypothetical protein
MFSRMKFQTKTHQPIEFEKPDVLGSRMHPQVKTNMFSKFDKLADQLASSSSIFATLKLSYNAQSKFEFLFIRTKQSTSVPCPISIQKRARRQHQRIEFRLESNGVFDVYGRVTMGNDGFRATSRQLHLFSGTDRGKKSHLRDGGQTRSFTATMAVRVRQPWGSVSFTVIMTVRVG